MALLIPNLDFEYELRGLGPGRRGSSLDRILGRQVRRWSEIMRLEPGYRHAQVLEWPPDPARQGAAAPSDLSVSPWGVTPTALELVGSAAASTLPDPIAVRWANAKSTSHQLERSLGIALPHACRVDSVDGLERAIARCPHPWVAKHPFGVSGRERLLGQAGVISEDGRRWARRALSEAGEGLIFEPWVDKALEWSLQFDIDPTGEVVLLGSCRLHAGPRGQFAGHSVGGSPAPDALVGAAGKALEELARAGYHGPVGVDAFEGSLGGEAVLRPVCEINARMTFGRLALRLATYVPADRFTWHHPTRAQAREAAPEATIVDATEPGRYRLPEFADPSGRSGTSVVIDG